MRIRTVDVFTDRPFSGNPAAVVLLPAGAPFPEDDRLQRLAGELNLSETAYARPLAQADPVDWELRWFTPRTEVNLCGHATLATAHVLRNGDSVTGELRFHTRGGVLRATVSGDGITLDFPTAPLTAREVPEGVSAALGAQAQAAYDTGPDVGDLLVELADETAVRTLSPDLTALGRLPHRGVIVTAGAATSDAGYDYVSRFFAPAVGIPEDPVTGSAHTALAPLWSGRTGRHALTGRQLSARPGTVHTRLRGARTELTGSAVTVLDAELRTTF
ncbi:PhzF family phenazine biosynthesis protein [Streptomyces oceani]|uniref:Oxidoreductase n=1 Tax=Streptomyces oceani TaxID=1075402 RepID=A0A1E7JMN1_9ACTN|nr:PhzF family phenazine biosynthesis protein [Streptomyces oceani]OEU89526.1 oxidoreductase [Streptomyces oceani]